MSGIDLPDGKQIRKGAADAVVRYIQKQGGTVPSELHAVVDGVATSGATPLVVTEATQVVGVVVLEDVLKPAISERLERLHMMEFAPS